jgi:Lon protease-like protein
MFELPLFPLNTVLFPGMPLHLHIFEERYKRMVNNCLQSDRRFGVVMIQSGLEALGPLPEPCQVGCVAQIIEVAPLGEGRMNLVVRGGERFRILTIDHKTQPYLIGKVELFPLRIEDQLDLQRAALHLRPRLDRYTQLLMQMSDLQSELGKPPDDPELLAYLAAILLQLPIKEKQELLELENAQELYARLDGIFDRELALMRAMLTESSRDGIGVFSRN